MWATRVGNIQISDAHFCHNKYINQFYCLFMRKNKKTWGGNF